MKSIRILLTEKCNANCKSCFNSSYRRNKDMNIDDFKELCDYLSKNNIEKIKIMGGEPTIHPNFIEIVEYAQAKISGIHIFTNALNESIFSIKLRDTDSIVYNASFLNEQFMIEKLLLNQLGSRAIETQISSDTDIEKLKNNLSFIISKAKEMYGIETVIDKIGINLTLNCIENIFDKKEIIIEKWNDLYTFIKSNLGIDMKVDHSIPWCFFVNTDMKVKQGIWKCSYHCSGLIDTDLNLRYCNQLPKVLIPLRKDKRFIPIKIVENYLHMTNLEKINGNLNKICKDCIFFGEKCNGGCFMHKEFITKESVIENTCLPKN